jgi:Uncharacterised nucleotidyltransferase
LSSVSELILAASLPGCKNAIQLWKDANTINPLYYWSGTDARLVPAFYANHCLQLDDPEFRVINGVYKSVWSKNSISLSAAAGLLNALTEMSIDYRMIKGGAICLILRKFGARRMGDLDLVFYNSDRKKVKTCLLKKGFLPRYPGDRRSLNNEIWENRDGVVLDLHFINRLHFLNIAFDSLITRRFANHDFRIPSYQSMAMVAIDHGYKGNSLGDLPQAIWDCSMLSKHIDWKSLVTRSFLYGKSDHVMAMIDILIRYDEIKKDERYLSSVKTNPLYRIYNFLRATAIKVSQLPLPIIINRNVIFENGALKWRNFMNQPIYHAWLILGSIGPLERFAQKKFGGLLRPNNLKDVTCLSIDLGESPTVIENEMFSAYSCFSNELRIKVSVPESKRKLLIELELESFTARMLFVNGIGSGHITPKQGNRYEVYVSNHIKYAELSFRDFSKFPNRWKGHINLMWERSSV